jgi:hypothetical protein
VPGGKPPARPVLFRFLHGHQRKPAQAVTARHVNQAAHQQPARAGGAVYRQDCKVMEVHAVGMRRQCVVAAVERHLGAAEPRVTEQVACHPDAIERPQATVREERELPKIGVGSLDQLHMVAGALHRQHGGDVCLRECPHAQVHCPASITTRNP